MGVKFDRILEDFDGPFGALTDFAKVPAGTDQRRPRRRPVTTSATRRTTASSSSTGCLKAGEDVSWLAERADGRRARSTSPRRPTTRAIVEKAAAELGVSFQPAATAPAGRVAKLRAPRIALFDHVRQQQHAVGLDAPRPRELRVPVRARVPARSRQGGPAREVRRDRVQRRRAAAVVAAAADAAAEPRVTRRAQRRPARRNRSRPGRRARPGCGRGGRAGSRRSRFRRSSRAVRARCRRRRSRRSKQFVKRAARVIAIGAAAMGAVQQFGLPAANHLVENGTALPREKFYVPGAVLRVAVDDTQSARARARQAARRLLRQRSGVQAGRRCRGAKACADRLVRRRRRRSAAAGRGASSYLDKGIAIIEATRRQGPACS